MATPPTLRGVRASSANHNALSVASRRSTLTPSQVPTSVTCWLHEWWQHPPISQGGVSQRLHPRDDRSICRRRRCGTIACSCPADGVSTRSLAGHSHRFSLKTVQRRFFFFETFLRLLRSARRRSARDAFGSTSVMPSSSASISPCMIPPDSSGAEYSMWSGLEGPNPAASIVGPSCAS